MATVLICLDELIASFERCTPYQTFARLGCPKYILAPMVLQSELPFRMMCRAYGTQLCYSPMITSSELIRDYQRHGSVDQHIVTCPDDRPLVVQLCSGDATVLNHAAHIIEDNIACDAICVNLGCPQTRAGRDVFGAFLLHQPDAVSLMIRTLVQHRRLPIFCKIRLLPTLAESLKFVRMLVASGVSLVAIHGRQITAKNRGSADLAAIRSIKAEITDIPIISNGNVRNWEDVQKALAYTACDGVMSASAIRTSCRGRHEPLEECKV